jgi:signal transduction histidine kinase
MLSRRRYLTRLLTFRYILGLVLIGLMVTASYLTVVMTARVEREGYIIASLAAEQRVASQRIPFLANAYINATDEETREEYRGALAKAVLQMADRHEILSLRTGPTHIPAGMRTILKDIYLDKTQPFADQVDNFLGSARGVLAAAESDLNPDMPDLVRLNVAGGGYLLHTHGLVGRLLRQEAISAIDRINDLEMLLWIATLVLLVTEIPLIFQPMARRAANILGQLQAARVKAEREAAAAEAAREGQASFIRTMSHELRTPLNAILGMNQLTRMGGLSQKQAEYTEDIESAGRHLLNLIDDILEFSRLEAKQVSIHTVRTSLAEEMACIESLLRPLSERKGLGLTCSLGPGLAEFYMADGLRIRQVLLNMAGNAIKFTEKGAIVIRAVHAGQAGHKADLVRFEVEDTGIGVSPEAHERIFEEFQQADTSLTRKYGGSGLGLAISSRLVNLMGGEIGVESIISNGSLFWFALPLERFNPPVLPEISASMRSFVQ